MENSVTVDASGKIRGLFFKDRKKSVFDITDKGRSSEGQRYFYGHGKLLLTGEYLVMDGAKALALPTILGQSLSVKSKKTFGAPRLIWKSLDYRGKAWFYAEFEPWHFEIVKGEINQATKFLQKILLQARKQNPHFLRDEKQIVNVETRLEFPLEWGLGSSSTLMYNIAQWAYISPFELAKHTFNGSGYDIACAQSMTPIVYQLNKGEELSDPEPSWKITNFKPPFLDQLYFVFLGEKKETLQEISYYRGLENRGVIQTAVKSVSEITDELMKVRDKNDFDRLLCEHEKIVGGVLGYPLAKERLFADYWGAVKSQGAWGGDFVLVTTDRSEEETRKYFKNKGYDTVIPYKDIICDQFYNNFKKKAEIQ